MGIDIKNQFFLPEMGLEFGLWRLKKKLLFLWVLKSYKKKSFSFFLQEIKIQILYLSSSSWDYN